MPTEEEFQEAKERLTQYVEDIGDVVDGDLDSRGGIGIGGPEVEGFWCEHGSSWYAIIGEPTEKYFQIIYPRLVLPNIAQRLDEDAVDELLNDFTEDEIEEALQEGEAAEQVEPEDIPDELIQQLDLEESVAEIREADELPEELQDEYIGGREYLASEEWLRSLESELMQDIKYHLKEKLTSTDASYTLITPNGDVIYGFQVNKKVFPYEGEFRLKEFNDCVQATVSIGVAGDNFLATTFGLGDELTTPSLPNV